MRILLTTDTVGGVWTYCMTLARALSELDCRVALATMGEPVTGEQRAEAASVPGLKLHESRYRLEWMSDPWDDVCRAGNWLLSLEERVQPDVIHLNGYTHGALPWHAPVVMVAHSCVLSWWRAVKGEAAPPEWNRYTLEVARGIGAADVVVAPTRAMLDAANHYYGPLRVTQTIPNGQEPALFPPANKEPFIFSAGRVWDEAKNVSTLAEVAPQLAWPVYVAGETRHPERNEASPVQLQTLGRLSRADLAGWLGRASIYALPARYEPFGLSALEAAFAGCALVLGDIPSLREVWEDAAQFVQPGDTEALRRALSALIADDALRTRFAHAARTRAFEYTTERMGRRYLNLYRSLTARAAAARVAPDEEEPACVS